MIGQKEAPAVGLGRGRQTPRGGAYLSCPPQYSRPVAVCQTDPLGLIEQARDRAEADRLRACFYATRCRKHQTILAELRRLTGVQT